MIRVNPVNRLGKFDRSLKNRIPAKVPNIKLMLVSASTLLGDE